MECLRSVAEGREGSISGKLILNTEEPRNPEKETSGGVKGLELLGTRPQQKAAREHRKGKYRERQKSQEGLNVMQTEQKSRPKENAAVKGGSLSKRAVSGPSPVRAVNRTRTPETLRNPKKGKQNKRI